MKLFLILIVIAVVLIIVGVQKENSATPTSNRISTALYDWLEEADEAYIRTFQQKDIRYFSPYTTDKISCELDEDILQKPERLFGTRRYRKRDWTIIEENLDTIKLIKCLTHRHIELEGRIRVPLGDDIKEEWTVKKASGSYTVINILERNV